MGYSKFAAFSDRSAETALDDWSRPSRPQHPTLEIELGQINPLSYGPDGQRDLPVLDAPRTKVETDDILVIA